MRSVVAAWFVVLLAMIGSQGAWALEPTDYHAVNGVALSAPAVNAELSLIAPSAGPGTRADDLASCCIEGLAIFGCVMLEWALDDPIGRWPLLLLMGVVILAVVVLLVWGSVVESNVLGLRSAPLSGPDPPSGFVFRF